MRICVAQIGTAAGDFAGTRAKMAAWSERAKGEGAGLVVFPAPAFSGLSGVAAPDREGFFADAAQALAQLASSLACPSIVPVCTEIEGSAVCEAFYIEEGSVKPLRLMAAFKEAAARNAGGDDAEGVGLTQPVLEVGGLSIGVAFTYDDVDEFVKYDYQVDAVVFLSTYGFAADDPQSAMGASLAETLFMDDADAMNAWVVGVGPVGCYDLEPFCGSSFAVAPWGEIAAQAPAFEEALMTVDIDRGFEGPLARPLQTQVYDPSITAWEAAAEGTRAIVRGLGATDAHVLLDGTLGPMVACTLAVDALGPTHVCPWVLETGDASRDAASASLARSLRLDARRIGASELGLVGDDPELARAVAHQHMARAARVQGACVVGSADKTALALGSAPAWELGCVLPLGDLYRSDVLALCRMRNTVSPVVPPAARRAFAVEDVPGLSAQARDPEAAVELLDFAISSYVEYERPLSEVALECGSAELAEAVVAIVRRTLPLLPGRLMAPVLSTRTLDEARGPAGLGWRDRVRSADEKLDLEALAQRVSEAADPGEEARDAQGLGEALELFGLLGQVPGEGGFPAPGASGAKGDGSSPRPSGGGIDWSGPFSEN